MVDLEVIASKGGSPKDLKPKFTNLAKNPKVKELVELGATRIDEGMKRSLASARTYWAIDRAYDVAQRQVSFTLVDGLLNSGRSQESILSTVKAWGLDRMLSPVYKDGKQVLEATGDPSMKLDLPTFFNLYVPLVQAYTKIRWAKLFNDRNLTPLYKFDPIRLTQKNRLKAQIITDRVQRMATEMNYKEDERQSMLQALLYGICINFPMEDWYSEKQTILDGKKQKTITVREGLRYAIPHPSRTIYDLSHRLPTLNTNTGVEWAGYWDIVRFGEIDRDKRYWNTDQIDASYGRFKWPQSSAWKIYGELFPCVAQFPSITSVTPTVGDHERVSKAFYYTAAEKDQGITICPMFMRVIPSEWDLYDYDSPVWHRFVYAAEENVIYCSPLAYCPGVAYLYDYDQNRDPNTSLGLELLPWQDMLGNYLTQYLLSVKRNLGKVVFWNTDILDQKYVNEIKNLGEKLYRDLNLIPFSGRELGWQQTTQRDAFYPVVFPNLSTQEIAQAINMLIMVMERMLGYSSQEVGAPAAHEQSATEVNIISLNTSTRQEFTGSFIDAAIQARKVQLYDALMAYSDDEIMAEVAELNDADRKALEDMGFKVEEEATSNDVKVGIKGNKSALRIDGFAQERDGVNRIQDSKIAATMIQTFQAIFSNQVILQHTSIQNLVDMFNQILVYAGLPRDFRLKLDPKATAEQQQANVQQQLQVMQQVAAKVSQAVVGQELGKVADGLKATLAPMAQQQQELQAALMEVVKEQKMQEGAITGIIAKIQQMAAMPAPVPVLQPTVPPSPLPPSPPIPNDSLPPGGPVGPEAGIPIPLPPAA